MGVDTHAAQVKVFCRIKPNFDGGDECITCLDETSLSIQNTRSNIHSFCRVFTSSDSQSEVFGACLLPYVTSVLNGESVLFFDYGVTGSGKTYTMQGTMSDPGFIPRALDTIFNSIASNSTLKYVGLTSEAIMDRQRFDYSSRLRTPLKPDYPPSCLDGRLVDPTTVPIPRNHLYSVFITYIELYNDVIYDLLEVPTEDANRSVYVHGVTELEVKSANEALRAYHQGQKRRRVGATAMNKESSRSHGIFTIRILDPRELTAVGPPVDDLRKQVSLLWLILFCGRSAKVLFVSLLLATINKSLLTLRKCVEVLRMNQSARVCQNPTVQQQIVPYRDCKLTRLFKSFFEGCGQVAILVCVHPTLGEYSETVVSVAFLFPIF
ncbi:unnamed protein product, partial [Hydatigera taeniaeformis]|uniref:Kinesin motor domain-containing protein n=1 Tax=Hydatigena taeniaeformis TaxID=6205 RepID=A0A0R3WNN6_HYDTA